MKIKKFPLYIGIAIVLFSLIGNYAVFASKQLKDPIMLKHYYEIPASKGYVFNLHYINNRSDNVDILWVTIPGIDFIISSYEGQTSTYRHYQVKTIALKSMM